MRAQLGSGEVTLRRWREQDAPVLYRVVRESIEHLRPWMAWVADWARGTAFNYAIFVSGRLAGARA